MEEQVTPKWCWSERKQLLEQLYDIARKSLELAKKITDTGEFLGNTAKTWTSWPDYLLKEYGLEYERDYDRFFYYSAQGAGDIDSFLNGISKNLQYYLQGIDVLRQNLKRLTHTFIDCFLLDTQKNGQNK